MASRAKSKVKAKARRNLFSELMEGMEALGESRRENGRCARTRWS